MEIKQTIDYDMFTNIKGNRGVLAAHVRKLQKSMQECPELLDVVPVLINENNEVIDGQHRIAACKALEIPVRYVVVEGLNLKDIQRINTTSKAWGIMDYVQSYMEVQNGDYTRLFNAYSSLRKEIPGLGMSMVAQLHSANSMYISQEIKNGTYQFAENEERIEAFKDFVETLPTSIKFFTNNKFVRVLPWLISHPNYDHAKMLMKLKEVGYRYVPDGAPGSSAGAFNILEKVYNYKSPKRVTFN